MEIPTVPEQTQPTDTPEEKLPEKSRFSLPNLQLLRPEWILGIIAAAAALVLAVVLLMSRAYFPEKAPVPGEEDPEALLHQQMEDDAPWPPPELFLEPTVPETEPETPTIPRTGIPMTSSTFSMTATII